MTQDVPGGTIEGLLCVVDRVLGVFMGESDVAYQFLKLPMS